MTSLPQKLEKFKTEELLSAIDLELYHFFAEMTEEESILLSVVLLSYLYRQGNVCLDVNQYGGKTLFEESTDNESIKAPSKKSWLQALQSSDLVGNPGDFCPLVLDQDNRLYFHKLWHYENRLARQILAKNALKEANIDEELLLDGLDRLFPKNDERVDWQKVAAATAVKKRFSVISGGPGTGKTSTVVRILALLGEQALQQKKKPVIALAAPTGKAAARLQQSILEARIELHIEENVQAFIPGEAKTIHQILGARQHTAELKYNAENPLPVDVLIVDEASMIDQALMSKLMNALMEKTKLILLGDKDQLASVEAGAVLGNICGTNENMLSKEFADYLSDVGLSIPNDFIKENVQPLTNSITLLTKNFRFKEDSGISRLANEINRGNSHEAEQVLVQHNYRNVSLNEPASYEELENKLFSSVKKYLSNTQREITPEELFSDYSDEQILCAHRRGPFGITYLNNRIEALLKRKRVIFPDKTWYVGRPIIINQNDYRLGLYNGDIGICIKDENERPAIAFQREGTIVCYSPVRLSHYDLAYALTIHKSQGSEFNKVLLTLPDEPSRLITRELLYTAVTRARNEVQVIGSAETFSRGCSRKVERSSGLRSRLWE